MIDQLRVQHEKLQPCSHFPLQPPTPRAFFRRRPFSRRRRQLNRESEIQLEPFLVFGRIDERLRSRTVTAVAHFQQVQNFGDPDSCNFEGTLLRAAAQTTKLKREKLYREHSTLTFISRCTWRNKTFIWQSDISNFRFSFRASENQTLCDGGAPRAGATVLHQVAEVFLSVSSQSLNVLMKFWTLILILGGFCEFSADQSVPVSASVYSSFSHWWFLHWLCLHESYILHFGLLMLISLSRSALLLVLRERNAVTLIRRNMNPDPVQLAGRQKTEWWRREAKGAEETTINWPSRHSHLPFLMKMEDPYRALKRIQTQPGLTRACWAHGFKSYFKFGIRCFRVLASSVESRHKLYRITSFFFILEQRSALLLFPYTFSTAC